jgi:L-threonylcarbamoyladenylate synthase
VLRDGGIVVFPTETVYGIGAAAHSCFGPHEIFDIKVRPLEKPLPWLIENDDALLDKYGVEVPSTHTLAKAFWPGALTLVVKASDVVSKDFRADDGTVGLRSPDHEVDHGAHPRLRRADHRHLGQYRRHAGPRQLR